MEAGQNFRNVRNSTNVVLKTDNWRAPDKAKSLIFNILAMARKSI
jgi:hypothetical protein